MSAWSDLGGELDRWTAAGQVATLWWRDDDAVEPTPRLEQLFELASRFALPIGLAVIPSNASPALARACALLDGLVEPLQHGYAHLNHSLEGEKKCELSDLRDPQEVRDELSRGVAIMASLFGAKSLPVLVPPWNRIGARITAQLDGLGFAGLSCYGGRRDAAPARLRQVNTHVDIMRWRPIRGFLGESEALGMLVAELRDRRETRRDEPVGLLTHHLVHDAPAWRFLEHLLDVLSGHPGARVHGPAQVFNVTEVR